MLWRSAHEHSFAISRTANHSRHAHNMTNSGAMMVQSMICTRFEKIFHWLSSRPGILGWTDTQVQANIVAEQLQKISHIDLCWSMQPCVGEIWSNELPAAGKIRGDGVAWMTLRERQIRVNNISIWKWRPKEKKETHTPLYVLCDDQVLPLKASRLSRSKLISVGEDPRKYNAWSQSQTAPQAKWNRKKHKIDLLGGNFVLG